jgi:hypothetical protein
LNFRAILESTKASDFDSNTQNAITFLRSQHMYKVSLVQTILQTHTYNPQLAKTLLDRYNPLIDLTAEERIEATARRVGLNMPIAPRDKKAE